MRGVAKQVNVALICMKQEEIAVMCRKQEQMVERIGYRLNL